MNESIESIIAEMRREIGDGTDTYCGKRIIRYMNASRVRLYCDRIEAAWKRDEERAVEHATRHAEAVARDNCRDCVYNPKGKNYEGGNAAAIREALIALVEYSDLAMTMGVFNREHLSSVVSKARAALSAPARNCDMYDNWYDAHQAWERLQKDELDYFVDENGVRECEQAWLFAPAERKGNCDGK